MRIIVPTRPPFSFEQTLAFVRRFPPSSGSIVVGGGSLYAAVAHGGRAQAFTLRMQGGELVADVRAAAVARRAAELVGARDDLGALYAAAETDPPFAALVRRLYGLHHVRFLGLEDIAVYCVLMQRTPMRLATRFKQRFLDRFGLVAEVAGHTLRAVPDLATLAELDAADIAEALGHRAKAERIVAVVRGVAALGEPFLREAPYAEARRALLAIPGIGPFSAGAILLRGLGRMDELPSLDLFERDARVIYGRAWNPRAIARRYGDQIGYWSFYVKTGAARLSSGTSSSSACSRPSRAATGRADPRRSRDSSRA